MASAAFMWSNSAWSDGRIWANPASCSACPIYQGNIDSLQHFWLYVQTCAFLYVSCACLNLGTPALPHSNLCCLTAHGISSCKSSCCTVMLYVLVVTRILTGRHPTKVEFCTRAVIGASKCKGIRNGCQLFSSASIERDRR